MVILLGRRDTLGSSVIICVVIVSGPSGTLSFMIRKKVKHCSALDVNSYPGERTI